MSHRAIATIAQVQGLNPPEKLVLFQLADAHNAATDQCNPSQGTLAALTGLSHQQVARAVKALVSAGHVEIEHRQFRFPKLGKPEDAVPVPTDWRPSSEAIQSLCDAYPRHHFDPEDAARDFIQFCQRRNICLAPGDRDRAFIRNISHILAVRGAGEVEIGRRNPRAEPASIRSLLAGLR